MERTIIAAIKKHKKFLVTMHVNPDPDAMGAALAMTLFLKSIGKTVRLVNDGPHPQWLDFMPQSKLCEAFDEKMVFKPEVALVLDCGDKERTGRVARLMTPGVIVINIDHHVTNTKFGDHNLVHMKRSSTSEILYDFLKVARCKFTHDMAVLLYLGILTDTGSFGFDSTSSHTHQVISDLLKHGFSVSDLYRQVYETMPKKDLKAFLAMMNTLTLHSHERVACLTITVKQARKFSDNFDLKDKVFSFLRSVKGLEVIMILAEQDKKRTRLNLRSRGDVDVARFASKFNGGGHKKASGGFVDMPLSKAKAHVLKAMIKEL
ncbi:MAG: bifunctional oligoribonuclease/PAP phosphatase NrnA [Candidatus Omnitrophica bacterium]|nr:bifunctional oligoribonuclease/PAP phosphatase NrnA [Candidatus Omnitrophota bacterium]